MCMFVSICMCVCLNRFVYVSTGMYKRNSIIWISLSHRIGQIGPQADIPYIFVTADTLNVSPYAQQVFLNPDPSQ